MKRDELSELRRDYAGRPLLEAEVASDPVVMVRLWLEEAVRAEVKDANAMTLATVDADGAPDARVVLLKGIESGRFVFYTNYQSAKGQQLDRDPRATLVLFWAELERQVRIRGRVARVSREASRAYFHSRPRASQLGAWASAQSTVLASREALEHRFAALEEEHRADERIPLPEHWGGYEVEPYEIELWQGRASRLHDRLRAVRTGSEGRSLDAWRWERLSP